MTKAKKRARTVQNRFDGEALGLVLFALGIFLIITLVLPAQGAGFMSQAHAALMTWLSWGSYTLPMVPLCYGILIFLNKELRQLTRRLLGAAVVVLSLLALQELFFPNTAGALAALALGPLRVVSYAAALLPIITLTLGIELVLRLPALSLLKSFFRTLSAGVGLLLGWVQAVIEARQEGKETAHQRQQVRQHLSAHSRDLELLGKLYPDSRELQHWKDETKDAGRQVRALDEHGLKDLEAELKHWRDVSSSFVLGAGRDLHAAVEREAPDAGAEIEMLAQEVRAGRHELSLELPSTLASGALERLRRSLVMDLYRLSTKAGGLERERRRAAKALEKPDTTLLARERPAHAQRVQGWRELAEAYAAWSERSAPYAGWPELARAYDASPTRLAETLEQALLTDPDAVLSERHVWEEKLEQAQPDSASAPLLDFDFGEAVSAALGAGMTAQPPLIDLQLDGDRTAVSSELRPTETLVMAAEPVTVGVGSGAGQAPAPISPLPKPSGRNLDADSLPWEDEAEVTLPTPTRSRPQQGALELALPGVDLLDPIPPEVHNTAQLDLSARQRAGLINETLGQFGLAAKVVDFARGPTVTRYEIEPAPGEKISRIASLSNDLARALAVGGVRVEAPVPGKSVIGLEVPNAEREPVTFHTAVAASTFKHTRARLPIILGKSIDGELMVGDLAKMPHLLIAGSTGSGKSVCVNTLITSLLYKYLPTELRFLMIDPKMVELTPYDGIPHLVRGVVTNPMDAAGVLLGAVAHMERRYKMMSQIGAKNLEQYNAKMRQVNETELPHLVIIIDELADLMITSPKEVESAIMRLAQMARATGMHLVLATQRPSVDILTSLIKVNVPARIAFAVSSSHDSRTILDSMGAERLTGMGDMLFYQPGLIKPIRLQGPYISEDESNRITEELRRQVFEDAFVELYGPDFDGAVESGGPSHDKANLDFSDPLLRQAAEICIEEGQGSVSRLQRRLSVGHARAGKLMDLLEAMGIVSKHQGSKPREVLINREDLPEYFGK
ncbi:cell division protein FtsK [Deinococcus irradiatisoli]|uniref:Cell division protein FtsK n=1 Tax=Deinococcus irradiatisoli TaxID=2202254 RepID=A0A2Z3JC30_9DEIO|nr:DNA translocase FtsK [Deinococcus irradiatisoli]AWN22717.1 cell division protein FtsK [Deinococcus irradiatisoli]